MNWRWLFPKATSEEIISEVEKYWDLDSPLPLPRFEPLCVCGNRVWHARLWVFWDRGDDHRVKHRCDVSLKCVNCAQVAIWGVPLPVEYVEWWGQRFDTQIDFKTAREIFLKVEMEHIDPAEWREGG